MSIRLLDVVSTLICDRPRSMSMEALAAETGVSVPKLYRLGAKRGQGVPVDEVQTVYETLARKPLIGN